MLYRWSVTTLLSLLDRQAVRAEFKDYFVIIFEVCAGVYIGVASVDEKERDGCCTCHSLEHVF